MEKFEAMQQFALSWALVFLVAVFVGVLIWAFWPGNKRAQDEAARSIFRHEDRPANGDSGT
jgi:cytochrome c oxidase cbb3-type subunit IV